jgi:hypothetical protein
MTARPRLTGNRCQCASCGLLFTSPREFDRHRIGDFAVARRCQSLVELHDLGWRVTARGFLMGPRLKHAPAGLEQAPGTHPAIGVAG